LRILMSLPAAFSMSVLPESGEACCSHVFFSFIHCYPKLSI
jgi:hypothetical protein